MLNLFDAHEVRWLDAAAASDSADGAARAGLRVQGLGHAYAGRPVFDGLDLVVEPGRAVALLGCSGAGKSTLLRLLAGLERPSSGQVRIDGQAPAVAAARGWLRLLTAVPRLRPWRRVAAQLERSSQAADAPAQARALLQALGLAAQAHQRIATLSQGQQQLLALASALMAAPRLLLLDNPLCALDSEARRATWALIGRHRFDHGCTLVLGTHERAEAQALADRVLVLEAGRLLAGGRGSA